ncbi:MAG: type II secretion system protein, partial [Prosthecobacter sp.]
HAFTLIELLVVITIIAILGSLAMSQFTNAQKTANQMKGVSNAKQIIIAMKQFAAANNSQYPDSVANAQTGGMAITSNDAFRNMFIEGVVTDERIFGCPAGFNTKDNNNIGTAPGFGMALQPGENHWAITQGQTDTTVGNMPLVFENPATQSWPPQWNVDLAGQIQPGRAWAGGQIIVGRNDGSVEVVNLNAKKGMAGPKQTNGMDMFTQASQGMMLQILNVVASGMGQAIGPGQMNPMMNNQMPMVPGGLPQPGGGLPPVPGQGLPGLPPVPGQPSGLPPVPGAP